MVYTINYFIFTVQIRRQPSTQHNFINNYNLSIAMEKNNLTAAQSLELITSMIQDSRKRLAQNSGTPFLVWGYITVAVSVFEYFVVANGWSWMWSWMWFAIPLLCGPIMMLVIRKQENGAKNLIDRTISAMWSVLGISTLFLYLLAVAYGVSLFSLIVLGMSIGTLTSGIVLRENATKCCGAFAMLASAIFPLMHIFKCGEPATQILIFAAIFVVMMIIPGHILNHKTKKR